MSEIVKFKSFAYFNIPVTNENIFKKSSCTRLYIINKLFKIRFGFKNVD